MAKSKKSASNEELDDEKDEAEDVTDENVEEAKEEESKSVPDKKSRSHAQEDGKHGDSNRGNVIQREMVTELKESYIDYAMSVIVSRALPDVRDGLKPVHRRILYAMMQSGLRSNTKHRKSMAVVGEVLKSYHPHGDTAVYESLVRMAQDFNMRYTLVDGQGNFGSIDGDGAAAARYTECRLTKIGDEMLRDIERDTVKFVDNYDGMTTEPTVLPSPLPQLLLNGSLGIAVGMATNIPPHNLTEVVDAAIHVLEHPKAETEDLFAFVQGPDFPTGGIIYDQKEIITAYSQGKGAILVRGKADVVEKKDGAEQIIITEIPYQVLKSTLVEQMAELVSEKKVEGIKDIRDLSDREGMRIVIDVKKSYQPQRILNRLYKFTSLQKTFHLNLLALVDGIQPEILSLADVLKYFIKHREEVVTRRTKYDLEKAKERAHILEGLVIALKNIDAVIQTIKKSADREEARTNLIKKFGLTERQAVAILEMRLQTLAGLERKKIEDELKELLERIKELLAILNSPEKLKTIIKNELLDMRERFGDKRRTKVVKGKLGEITEVDLVPLEETIVTLTTGGYIKRINPTTYKIQKRGGKGIMGMKTMQDDIVEHFLAASTHDNLMFFTDSGKVFQTQVYEIPEGNRVARGRGLLNFLELSQEEKVLSLIPMPGTIGPKPAVKEGEAKDKYLVMITKNGRIKKTDLKEFENVRKSGIIAIKLEKGDALKKVVKTTGEDDIILATKNGTSIRFKEKDIRPMGRGAAGVKGISLKKGDEIIGMDVIEKNPPIDEKGKPAKRQLLIVMEHGYGKRTDIGQYKTQGRGGSGIKTAKITSKTGQIVMSAIVEDIAEEEDLIVISQQGQVIRTSVKSISLLGRDTQGVRIMKMDEGDKVASGACLKD
jgi:DNA gyrase subunit A